jgi:hypothetical protein
MQPVPVYLCNLSQRQLPLVAFLALSPPPVSYPVKQCSLPFVLYLNSRTDLMCQNHSDWLICPSGSGNHGLLESKDAMELEQRTVPGMHVDCDLVTPGLERRVQPEAREWSEPWGGSSLGH